MKWNVPELYYWGTDNNKPRYMSSVLSVEDKTFPLTVWYAAL